MPAHRSLIGPAHCPSEIGPTVGWRDRPPLESWSAIKRSIVPNEICIGRQICTLRRPSLALVHHLAGPRRIVCTAALCWSSSDGRLPRDYESNTVLLCLVRSKRYSSLKFCIWPVLLYSVIIEDYIYVRVLAGLNTGCNNNIIKTYFRGLELGLLVACTGD